MSNVNTVHTIFGSGAAGYALAEILRDRGHQVRIVSRSGKGPSGVEIMKADASDPSAAQRATQNAAIVYNCANTVYNKWFTELQPLFRSILAATESAKARYICLDNLYMYGPINGPINEATPEFPTTNRCQLRKTVSDEALDLHRQGRLQVTLLRPSDYYGPGVTNAYLSDRVWKPLREGKAIDWVGDPDQKHSFAYIPDVARALADLGEHPDLAGQAWVSQHAPALPVRQFLELAAQLGHYKKPKIRAINRTGLTILGLFMPMLADLKDTHYQHAHEFIADGSQLEKKLGWSATPTEEALIATLGL